MGKFQFDSIKVLVTSHCNLNCKHCYQHFDKNMYQLKNDKLIEIVNFAVENKTKVLDLSGGEFFTHPFAYELLEYCISKNVGVNISTNATTNIDLAFFERYCDKKLISIQVSIDGLEKAHDARRGKGTYAKVIENVKALSKLGIKTTASMALDEDNYLDAIDILNLPYFSNVFFMPVALTGAAKINSQKNVSSDYEDTIVYIMRKTKCEVKTFAEQIFPHVMAVKYDGGLFISPTAADYNLMCLGNINEDFINDIADRFYNSDEFNRIKAVDGNIEECNNCRLANKCDRGCRLRALKYFGDMHKPDPFYCRVYNNEFTDVPIGKLFWGEK